MRPKCLIFRISSQPRRNGGFRTGRYGISKQAEILADGLKQLRTRFASDLADGSLAKAGFQTVVGPPDEKDGRHQRDQWSPNTDPEEPGCGIQHNDGAKNIRDYKWQEEHKSDELDKGVSRLAGCHGKPGARVSKRYER